MAAFDLRPLGLGEILDRTFSIYRSHFLLFIGIVGLPQILLLALHLVQLFLFPRAANPFFTLGALGLVLSILGIVIGIIAYLLSQGAVIRAVTDLYLGRPTSIQQSMAEAWGEIGVLFGVVVLNGLAIGGAFILLIIPGIYVLSRLLVCVPAALTEHLGPRASLSRSWNLTKGFAGRGFMIVLLYTVIATVPSMVIGVFAAIAATTRTEFHWIALAITSISSTITNVLFVPILLIATALFYFDLRVRKEGFDLQFMMNPDAERFAGPSSGVTSILS